MFASTRGTNVSNIEEEEEENTVSKRDKNKSDEISVPGRANNEANNSRVSGGAVFLNFSNV
jgi:hypothetical protein